ncbi:MAG: Ig-like domain-containing protein, partial [Limnohabitans sp.]|nr:Ig-like domain-containing protein [Limnohabitans sp.]
ATLSSALVTGEKLFYSKDDGITWTDITASVSGTQVSHADDTLTSTATIQMRVQDAAGNAGAADTQLVTIDTTGPTEETTDPLNPSAAAGKASVILDNVTSDNIVNAAEGAQANVAITGTARGEFTAGDVVTLTVNGKTFTGEVATNGTFSINVSGADLLADSDKKIEASLAARDVAGNVGVVTDTHDYTVNTTGPSTTVDITAITNDTGVSGSDFITSDNNGLTVSATLSAALTTGQKLFYSKDNGVTWTDITASVSSNSPRTAVSHFDSTLTSTATLQMQVRDAADNAGATDTQLVTIDTTGPTQETTDPTNPAAGKASLVLDNITSDNVINTTEGAQANVAITGTARGDFTAGDTVTLTVNGKTFTGTVNAQGVFSINVPGSDLRDATTKTVSASLAAKDKAGNTGTITDTQDYTVDTTAPTTTVDITAITNDTGVSNTDFITSDN